MTPSRRSLITGLIAGPAIVRVASLMPVKVWIEQPHPLFPAPQWERTSIVTEWGANDAPDWRADRAVWLENLHAYMEKMRAAGFTVIEDKTSIAMSGPRPPSSHTLAECHDILRSLPPIRLPA